MKEDISKCASFEEISAYVDGELEPSCAAFKHIESCGECRLRAERMRGLSRAVHASLSNPPGADRIARKCVEALRAERQISSLRCASYTQIFLKAAAAIAIFAGASVYVFELSRRGDETRAAKFDGAGKSTVAEADMKSRNTLAEADENGTRAEPAVHSPLNSLELSEMRTAGSGSSAGLVSDKIHFVECKGDSAAAIAPVVKHSWIWTKTAAAAPDIRSIISACNLTPAKSPEGAGLRIKTDKAGLVKLVRAINASGYELLSDSEPQPESGRFAGSPGDPVEYHVSTVER